MDGINFVIDSKGRKTAAIINLRRYRKLWEDFYDFALMASRADEPREAFDAVTRRLERTAARK